MKSMVGMSWREFLRQPERDRYQEVFVDNLHQQARALHRPGGIIAMVAWLNFAFRLDPVLHPEFPGLLFFRLALTLVGAYVFTASFFERLRGKGQGLLQMLLAFSFLSCSFFTGRLADDAAYVSGLQILILVMVAMPFLFRTLAFFYLISIVFFVGAVWIYQPDISSPAAHYSLNNLVIAYVIGLVLGFVMDRFRFAMFFNQVKLNRTVDELQYLLNDVAARGRTIADVSSRLLSLSDNMSAGAEKMAEKMKNISDTVSAAAIRMNINIQIISDIMENSSGNIQQAEKAVEDIAGTIHQIAENSRDVQSRIRETVARVGEAAASVQDLDTAADEIGAVAEAIVVVSKQTKLLSLNATIEAVRAGESGKGFAVVAGEVKQLAGQAGDATRNIQDQLNIIQATTTATVGAIQQVSERINSINQTVSSTAAALESQLASSRQISEHVRQTSSEIRQAAGKMAETSAVSANVTEGMEDLNRTSAEMRDISRQVYEGARELAGVAEDLKKIIAGLNNG